MSMSRKKEKAAAQKKETTRQLIGINDISDYGLKTSRGMLAFFSVKPTNLSVQPPEAVGGRIYALMTVLKGQTEIEMLALNSKEYFEDNKRYGGTSRDQPTAGGGCPFPGPAAGANGDCP